MTTSDAPSRPRGRRPVWLTVAVTVSLAILIGLGFWQLRRLEWKRDLLERIDQLQSAEARPANVVLSGAKAGDDVNFLRVRAACPGLDRAPFLELYVVIDGQAGWRLVSECRLSNAAYGSILVDRGFVSDAVSDRPLIEVGAVNPVLIEGVLRKPDPRTAVAPPDEPEAGRWYSRDVGAMASALGAPDPAPYFLMAETSSNPNWSALRPVALPVGLSNRHLEYALTWFGLAAALVGVWLAFLRSRQRVA